MVSTVCKTNHSVVLHQASRSAHTAAGYIFVWIHRAVDDNRSSRLCKTMDHCWILIRRHYRRNRRFASYVSQSCHLLELPSSYNNKFFSSCSLVFRRLPPSS
ncbi:hypothetical protein XENOCAPTIV_003617 [Xenoophorus captivus]|uniref:Uncharacterized protein n=1 Tax=Xenoophorus captivus TaxID=1517983 RepID=A0ABV0QY99_9TELE